MVSCCCLLLPVTPTAYPTVSKSRVREDVRVQVPPPAPRQSEGLATIGCQPFFIALVLMEGLERARGADEQEEERDARERVSPEPRRKSRSHGWAAPFPNELRSLGYPATNSPRGKAQAGKSLLRHHLKTRSYTCWGTGGEAAFGRL